jgi:hypothetical protein
VALGATADDLPSLFSLLAPWPTRPGFITEASLIAAKIPPSSSILILVHSFAFADLQGSNLL